MLTRLLLLLAIVHPVNAQAPERWVLASGVFDASEAEAMECYWNIGTEAMIVFKPKAISCDVARLELRGKLGRLVFVVEP